MTGIFIAATTASVIVLTAIILASIWNLARLSKERKASRERGLARSEYRDALAKLQQSNLPSDRDKVIERGRIYATLCKETGHPMLFDELQLQTELRVYDHLPKGLPQ